VADELHRRVEMQRVDDDPDEVAVDELADRPAFQRLRADVADTRPSRDAREPCIRDEGDASTPTTGSPSCPFSAAITSRSRVNTRARPVMRRTPSSSRLRASIAVLLITLPFGARFPTGKQTVEVMPFVRARTRGQITSSGSTPSCSRRRMRRR
jgi:hypothetical protein